jgi:hypothetical protein
MTQNLFLLFDGESRDTVMSTENRDRQYIHKPKCWVFRIVQLFAREVFKSDMHRFY